MINFIFPYRNREVAHVANSFQSLQQQVNQDFKVYLVDYGSTPRASATVKELAGQYNFVQYEYLETSRQPWNKSKALNSVIKNISTGYCFIADVDMIFSPYFIEKLHQLKDPGKAIYFQVGFLEPGEYKKSLHFSDYRNIRKSTSEATGMTLFPINLLKIVRGFDEFYHFWGAEDTDVHIRLRNSGYKVDFYDDEVMILHQWHPSYRSLETSDLSIDPQIKNIVQLNHQHLIFARENGLIQANCESWGNVMSSEEAEELKNAPVSHQINTESKKIDDLLFGQLPNVQGKILKIVIKEDSSEKSIKHRLKKMMRKKVPQYYSLKVINDKVLLHLISFYRNKPYSYRIADNLKEIEVALKL